MKRFLCICLAVVMLCVFTACGEEQPVSRTAMVLGEVCSLSLYGAEDETVCDDFEHILQSVAAEWDADLQKIRTATGEEIPIGAQLWQILKTAQEITLATDGAFDLTVGALSELWVSAKENGCLPTEAEVTAARFTVGGYHYRLGDLAVSVDEGTILQWDAIMAGVLADSVTALLETENNASALVTIGDVTVPIGDRPFTLEIADPATQRLVGTIKLDGRAAATIDSDSNRFEIGGEWYSPVINPKTGMPVDNDLVSVTVLAEDATSAQALANACLVMGADKAWSLLSTLDGVDAVLLKTDQSVLATDGITRV